MEQTLTESGWRGSPDVWLNAAYETLLDSGVDAVRIQTLSKKLNLARTSFYRPSRTARNCWRHCWPAGATRIRQHRQAGECLCRLSGGGDPQRQRLLVQQRHLRFEVRVRVRSWAMQSPEILAEVHRGDRTRIRAIADMFVRFGETGICGRRTGLGHLSSSDRLHLDADERRPSLSE